jgi:hypothetical protein
LANEPPGQREQTAEPVALKEPRLHGLQLDAPLSEAVPGGHCEQEDENGREKAPAGQGMHSEEPDEGAYDPAGQPKQDDDWAAEKDPVAH